MVSKRVFPKKPLPLKTRIIKHGSGWQVFDGRRKVQTTSTLRNSLETVRRMEKDFRIRFNFWVKHRRGR